LEMGQRIPFVCVNGAPAKQGRFCFFLGLYWFAPVFWAHNV
jgi:hypothetical protein